MTSEELRKEIDFLKEWKAKPSDRLRDAMKLLEKAYNSLDVREGELQDCQESKPSEWEKGILDAISDNCFTIPACVLKAAERHAAEVFGESSHEAQSCRALLQVLATDASGAAY